MQALHLLAACTAYETQAQCKKNIVEVIDQVAKKLGNTRAVCKKYYIHPKLFSLYEEGTLENYTAKGADEKVLMKILAAKEKKQGRR